MREQGGMVLLPHPFVEHRDPEMLAGRADLVEVFNGRASDAANRCAMELATRLGKPGFWASDAHLGRSLATTIVAVENRGKLKESLLHGAIRPLQCRHAVAGDVILSQVIKVVKTGDVKRAVRDVARRTCHVAERLVGQGQPMFGTSGENTKRL